MFKPEGYKEPKTVKTPKSKSGQITVEKQFADLVLSDALGQWMMRLESTQDSGSVFRWNGMCWDYVNAEAGTAMTADWLDHYHPDKATSANAENLWKWTQKRLRKMKPAPAREVARFVIPTKSGYLHLEKGGRIILKKPDPALGVDYVIDAKIPSLQKPDAEYFPGELPADSIFGKFITQMMPDPKVRAVVQELVAQTLLPMNTSVAMWNIGDGQNGKGTLVHLIEALHPQVCSLQLNKLGGQFSLEPIIGSSLILVDEVPDKPFDEELLKSLISQDPVSIDRKNEKAIHSYRSTAKWIISSNKVPHIRDKSNGVWRRIIFIPWKITVSDDEKILDISKTIIKNELHIVLDWLLHGVKRLVVRGRFYKDEELPDSIRDEKHLLRIEGDSILAWTEDLGVHCSANVKTSKEDVYKSYFDWCQSNLHGGEMKPESFWKVLRQRFQPTDSKIGVKRYVNISLVSNTPAGKERLQKQDGVVNIPFHTDHPDPIFGVKPNTAVH